MIISDEQFDLTVERAFIRGMEYQKKNQRDLETTWYQLGFNTALKEHGIINKLIEPQTTD